MAQALNRFRPPIHFPAQWQIFLIFSWSRQFRETVVLFFNSFGQGKHRQRDILEAPILAVRLDLLLVKYLLQTVVMDEGVKIRSPLTAEVVVFMLHPDISHKVICSTSI